MNPHTSSNKSFKIINSKAITDRNEKLTIKKKIAGTSLAVQCLQLNTSTAVGTALIAGQGLEFHMPYGIGKKIWMITWGQNLSLAMRF